MLKIINTLLIHTATKAVLSVQLCWHHLPHDELQRQTRVRAHTHSAHLQELLFMMDSTQTHPHTPISAHLQDLPMKFQNKHGYNLVIAKQETDLISRNCAISPWTSSKACLLLHPLSWRRVMSDSQVITMSKDQFCCPQALF